MARTATATSRTRPTGASGSSLRSVLRTALNAPLSDYYLLLASSALLVMFGTMVVLSASSVTGRVQADDPYFFIKRQAVFLVLGVVACWWTARRDQRTLMSVSWALMLLALALLPLTFSPLGTDVGGNRAWLRLGPFSGQPSEFAKLAMVVWGATVLHRKQKLLDQPRHLAVPLLVFHGLVVALVVLQKDLGTAMVMMFISVAMLFVVGVAGRVLAAIAGIVGAAVAALVVTAPNRLNRIMGFLDPHADALGVNMQPLQGLYSLAAGGWWGRGLGKSRAKYGLLSEAHTDYAFSILGEELGLFGTLLVVALFATLGFAGFRTAMRSDSLFTRMTAAGVTLWFTFQGLVNLGVVLRMLPVLGVPLPFISYGGSSLLANLIALGFLLACARHEPAARRVLARSKGKLPRLSTVVDGGRS